MEQEILEINFASHEIYTKINLSCEDNNHSSGFIVAMEYYHEYPATVGELISKS